MQSKFTSRNFNHNSSTYTCTCCSRRTRETGMGEADLDLCAFCYEVAGLDNEHNDGHIDDAEFNARLDQFIAHYGKRAHIGCVAHAVVTETPATSVVSTLSGLPDRRRAENKSLPKLTKSERAKARRAARKEK